MVLIKYLKNNSANNEKIKSLFAKSAKIGFAYKNISFI